MTVSLGGLALSDDLTLDIGPAAAGVNVTRLIGGAVAVQADPASGGRTLTLEGVHHWTLGQVEAIRAMHGAGLPLALVHHRGIFTALITDTTDLQPSVDYSNPTADDWYSGTITLIEV